MAFTILIGALSYSGSIQWAYYLDGSDVLAITFMSLFIATVAV